MSLADLQVALGTMVVTSASKNSSTGEFFNSFEGLTLTQQERKWLAELHNSAGFDVTCYIQKWWRQTKLQWTLPLTIAALGMNKYEELTQKYISTFQVTSLFFAVGALEFLDFLLKQDISLHTHVISIAQFERALLIVSEAKNSSDFQIINPTPSKLIQQHPSAYVVEFFQTPEVLLNALLLNTPLPEPSLEKKYVIVTSGLPYLWRPATEDEIKVFKYCKNPISIEEVLEETKDQQTLEELFNIRALCVAE